ncbi:MAG: heme exporter protein CcmB, partial [Myxococcota bacterium]
ALTRTFADERESGSLRALALIPGIQLSLYFGKALTNLIFMVLFEAALIPLLLLAFGVNLSVAPVNFFVAVAAGTLGFVILGTLLSAMLVHNRLREVMMPLILYPLLVPLFIGGVKAVGVLYTNDAEALAKSWDWIRLMVVMDIVFAVGAPAVFRFVLDAIE